MKVLKIKYFWSGTLKQSECVRPKWTNDSVFTNDKVTKRISLSNIERIEFVALSYNIELAIVFLSNKDKVLISLMNDIQILSKRKRK